MFSEWNASWIKDYTPGFLTNYFKTRYKNRNKNRGKMMSLELAKDGLKILSQLVGLLWPDSDEKSKRTRIKFNDRLFKIDKKLGEVKDQYPNHDAGEMESLIREKDQILSAMVREKQSAL